MSKGLGRTTLTLSRYDVFIVQDTDVDIDVLIVQDVDNQCDQIWRNFATFGQNIKGSLRVYLVFGKTSYLLCNFLCHWANIHC